MRFLLVKNWTEFQHYKDRNPPWIKFHIALIDDYEFCALPDISKAHLMLLWLFSSRKDGRIPDDPKFLQAKLGLDKPPDLDLLIRTGFLIEDDGENASTEKWASRYISDEVRARVLEKAGHKCQSCASTENVEIDHIIPVSRGGTGEESNLQALCRPCNRRKRVRSTCYVAAEQVATQTGKASGALARSREKRREETETECARENFEAFWQCYPRKVAKQEAEKAWAKLHPENGDFERIMGALENHKKTSKWQEDGGQFIPHPATWLNQHRFEDELTVPQPKRVAL